MNSSNVHVVNNVNFSQGASSNPKLHNGSVVNGRVLSDNGGNSYTLSVAGQKVNVTSQIPLKTGSLFTAKLGVSGNLVTLKLLDTQLAGATLASVNSSSFNSANPVLVSMLSNLGLPVTPESLKLLQFALNMGIKIENGKLVKAYVRGNEDSEKSEEKSQIALLMEEKCLNATAVAVEAVFQQMHEGNKRQNSSENQYESASDSFEIVKKDDVKDFFAQADEAALKNKCGALTLFNSVLSANENSPHWICFPFQWDYKNCNGVIRVLLDENKKNLNKIAVNCQNPEKKYSFMLYLNKGKVSKLRAGFTGSWQPEVNMKAQKLLSSLFGSQTEISLISEEELNGFMTEDVDIPVFRGEA